jgi:dephospho-CoA kinase
MSDALRRPVLRVGVTGGIASGKTTVAAFLEELGACRIDADRIAHELMEPGGAAYRAVVERFGTAILDGAGRMRRSSLAAVVFADPAARAALDAIIHPPVIEEVERRFLRCAGTGDSSLAVVDAALLVESGYFRSLHRLIVVRCGRETQLKRLLARGGLGPEEARARIESQAPLDAKLEVADYVIDTETALPETRLEVARVHASLLADFRRVFPC